MNLVHEIKRRDFDSTLYNSPAFVGGEDTPFDLYLYLRIYFQQLNPPGDQATFRVRDADGNRVECGRWTAEAWATFADRYLREVNSFWHGAFRLITPSYYTGLDYPPEGAARRRRDVNCGFRLDTVGTSRAAHVTIPIVKLANAGGFFRSHAMLYDDRDMDPMTFSSGTGRLDWSFFTMSHEVCHLLGLGHSNENSQACRNNPNSSICYGATLEQRMNVMGQGSELSLENALPWKRRIAQHTGTRERDWQVTWLSTDAAFRGTEHMRLH